MKIFRGKRSKGAKVKWIVAGALTGSLIVAASFFYSIHVQRNHTFFSMYYDAASKKAKSGNVLDARQEIENAARFASTRGEWTRVLNLACEFSELSRDHALFTHIALKAARDLPGNENFWALAVFGLLQTNQYALADKTAGQYLHSQEYSGIRTEASLRAGNTVPAGTAGTAHDSLYSTLFSLSRDETDPELMVKAGVVSKEKAFIKNAALLYASRGDIRRAFLIFSEHFPSDAPLSPALREIGSLIAYDAQNYDAALMYIDYNNSNKVQGEDSILLASEIMLRGSDLAGAKGLYKKYIIMVPESSWLPYLNGAWIARESGDFDEAKRYLKEGLSVFPDDSRLVLAYARLLYGTGRGEEADRILKSYSERFPKNINARLLYGKSAVKNELPERFEAGLWALFNDHPDSEETLRLLCWYLLGKGDLDGIRTVFENVPPRFAQTPSAVLYRGLWKAVSGNTSEALLEFTKIIETDPSWEAFYNIGIVYGDQGKWKEAERMFSASLDLFHEKAATRSEDPGSYDKIRARIYCSLGRAYAGIGKTDDMKKSLEIALVLDPGNLTAFSLLRNSGTFRGLPKE